MKHLLVVCVLLYFSIHQVIAGSVDSGVAPYERCALCHGLFGNTTRTKFPKLAGQNSAYLEKQIHDFISGSRSNDGGQMATVVTEIETEDIPEIVAWFTSQPAPEPYDKVDDRGAGIFADAGCNTCHIEQAGEKILVPLLSAQHPAYLAKQMKEYREGIRSDSTDGQMHKQSLNLPDQDIESISHYLASMKRRL